MSKTVLVVDDSRVSRLMICGFVKERYPDWYFIEGSSAEDALAKLDGCRIEYMTLDMNMPGMDGLTLGITLRQRYPEARIALVTANIQMSVRKRAEEAGLTFVPKPISKEKILGFIEAVMPSGGAECYSAT